MSATAKGEFKKALHVYRLTADKVQIGGPGGYGWQTYKPTYGGGGALPAYSEATSYNNFRYRIVDTTLEVKFDLNNASNGAAVGTAATGQIVFSLPTGCIYRQTTNSSGPNIGNPVGVGDMILLSRTSTVIYTGVLVLGGIGFSAYITTNGVATVAWGSASPADTKWDVANGFTVGGRLVCELDPTSPILGEAPVQLSNGTGSVLPTTQPGGQSGSLITGQFA